LGVVALSRTARAYRARSPAGRPHSRVWFSRSALSK
jgi:hypothetical protein